jgi:hypothetical protein
MTETVVRDIGVLLVACAIVTGGCSAPGPSPVVRTLTGDWGLGVSASPSCNASLPFGYGVAPRGGGRASLTQSGKNLSGTLYIFDTPSGTIDGTVDGGVVRFTFNLDGRNVGVLSPADEPCRVVGLATGSTDGYCYISVKISGEFACPYACTAADHILIFDRGRGGRGCH